MKCEHLNFEAKVDVTRLTDIDGKVIGYTTDIRVWCNDCRHPFEFIGVEAGYSPIQPMASVDAQELRAPIRPKGCAIMPAIPGYTVKAN